MLQMDCTRRLSVDIDIVCPPGTDVIPYLEMYADEYGFGEIRSVERLSRNDEPQEKPTTDGPVIDDIMGGMRIRLD